MQPVEVQIGFPSSPPSNPVSQSAQLHLQLHLPLLQFGSETPTLGIQTVMRRFGVSGAQRQRSLKICHLRKGTKKRLQSNRFGTSIQLSTSRGVETQTSTGPKSRRMRSKSALLGCGIKGIATARLRVMCTRSRGASSSRWGADVGALCGCLCQ